MAIDDGVSPDSKRLVVAALRAARRAEIDVAAAICESTHDGACGDPVAQHRDAALRLLRHALSATGMLR